MVLKYCYLINLNVIKIAFQFFLIFLFLLWFHIQVDTAGWLHRTKHEKGPSSLSIVQSRKNLMRAHVVALVLDAEEV